MLQKPIMKKHKYEKVIILGSDTIVCGRLDEFLDNDTTPVLASLNYWIHESTEHWSSPTIQVELPDGSKELDHLNINADVVCFNSSDALLKVITLSIEHYGYFSIQGKIVDSPYPLSKVSYNVRVKGVPRTDMIGKGVLKNCYPHNIHGFPYEWLVNQNLLDGQPSPIKSWYVKEDKLYTHDHKQIKVFHFVEGIGGRPIEKFNELINDFKNHWFNDDTIKFFQEQCKCTQFFKKSND